MNPDKLTQKSQEAFQAALSLAESHGHPQLEPEHLMISLFQQEEGIARRVFNSLGGNEKGLLKDLEAKIQSFPEAKGAAARSTLGRRTTDLYQAADVAAKEMGDLYLSSEHFVLVSLKESQIGLIEVFSKNGLDFESFKNELKKLRAGQKVADDQPESKFDTLSKYARDLTELAEKGGLDPVIGRDEEIRRVIQVLARRTKNNPILIGEPGVGKTAIAEGLAVRIVNQDVPEVLLGKRLMSLDLASLVAGAKYRGEFEDRLKAVVKEVVSSEGQIILFIDEIHTLVGAGKTDGAMDAGQILKPALARGELRCIGATTLDEHRQYIEKDKALERRFQTVLVDEPSVEDALTIMRGLKEKYEVHHGVRITDAALAAAVKLSHRYITTRFLPDKAIDLIDESASRLSIEAMSTPTSIDEIQRKRMQLQVEKEALRAEGTESSKSRLTEIEKELSSSETELNELKTQWQAERSEIESLKSLKKNLDSLKLELERSERDGLLERAAELKYGRLPELEKLLKEKQGQLAETSGGEKRLLKEEVTPDEIAEVVSQWTGVPVHKMLKSEGQKLLDLESQLEKRVVGQSEAMRAVSDAIRRARAEISDPNQPIGSFLFLGPTGVGKTETVKALAENLFDSDDSIIRLDMSEYMEKHSVARLIGAPPGYVGYEDGGQLTERVRRKPYSVILFDEVEKAHPDVFNSLLQVFDEGRLTDGQGRLVDFRNTLIVMTSNLGASNLLDEGLSREDQKKLVLDEVKAHFRPEFLNRLDEQLVFHRLGQEQIKEIVKIQLEDVRLRLAEKQVELKMSDSALELLGQRGFDPLYGARPLKRVIQNELLNPVAKLILSGELNARAELHVSATDLHLNFEISSPEK